MAVAALAATRSVTTIATAGQDEWDRTAHDLGWDHARHGLTPPTEHLAHGHPLRAAWQNARRQLGRRPAATGARGAAVQDWLSLRLAAWLRGVPVQALTVTPNHLRQLQVSHCPVTRDALRRDRAASPQQSPLHPAVVRLCHTAAYAAGHLAMLSQRAADALADQPFDSLANHARQGDETQRPATKGALTPLHWSRLAVLRSFVTPLPHAQAATLPLLVLPPNRVQVRNPIQSLQVLVTLMLAKSGWSKQLPALLALMPDAAARRDLHSFFLCLMARTIAAGRPGDAQAQRWALEDAWRHPQVQAHWKRFALRLDDTSAQTAVDRLLAAGLAPKQLHGHTDEQATDGWQPSDTIVEVTDAPATPRRSILVAQANRGRTPAPAQHRLHAAASWRAAPHALPSASHQLNLLADE